MRPNKYNKSTSEIMTEEALRDWKALDALLNGGSPLTYQAGADRAQARVFRASCDEVVVTRADKKARKKQERVSRRKVRKFHSRIRRALSQGHHSQVCDLVFSFMNSFDAKYVAYLEARKKMRRNRRPHLYKLPDYASQLNMFHREFEHGSVRLERKLSAPIEGRRPEHYRPITCFGIHNRARQYMLKMALEMCNPNHCRHDQYGTFEAGLKDAVNALIDKMNDPNMQFFAEVDFINFFATIGEEDGRIASENRLLSEFWYIPRAVIESSMLTNGTLVSLPLPSQHALSHDFHAQTGVPQGSASSSFIAELVASDIITNAETCQITDCEYITYVDNIAISGPCRDDVHLQIKTLSACASSSRFGLFRLACTSDPRHKSQGIIFLGYYLRYDEDTEGQPSVFIDVSDKAKAKLKHRLVEKLRHFQPSSHCLAQRCEEKAQQLQKMLNGWLEAYSLCETNLEHALEVIDHAFRDFPRLQRHLKPLLEELIC